MRVRSWRWVRGGRDWPGVSHETDSGSDLVCVWKNQPSASEGQADQARRRLTTGLHPHKQRGQAR